MKILLLGVGRQGKRILELLLERGLTPVFIYDLRKDVLKFFKEKCPEKTRILDQNIFDLSEKDRIALLKSYNCIIDALPAASSFELLKSASKAGSKLISVSFLEEDFMALDGEAKENGAVIVPDCGIAPGFSHLLAGYSLRQLGEAKKVVMELGAIPQNPVPPFNHNITWSTNDLIEEYIRPAKIRVEGKMKTVEPLEEITAKTIFGFQLESFVTDGARSLLTNFPDIPDIQERTLRHPGHLNYMKQLKKEGLLEREEILKEGKKGSPYKLLVSSLEEKFGSLPKEDLFLMEVTVEGKEGKKMVHQYHLGYDSQNQIPALVNAVATTAVQTLELMREGKIDKTGILPLEKLATETVYQSLIQAHKNLGAKIIKRGVFCKLSTDS